MKNPSVKQVFKVSSLDVHSSYWHKRDIGERYNTDSHRIVAAEMDKTLYKYLTIHCWERLMCSQ
jgi:hypothetical protein